MTPRTPALAALLITTAAVLYAAGGALTGSEPALGWLFQAIIHLGELLAVVALVWSGAAARLWAGVAIAGQAVLIAAEVIWPSAHGLGDTLFSIGPVLTGVGLIVAGIAILRGRRLPGALRFAPLTVGLYVFAVLIPVLIGSGGPPAPAALWSIAGWDLLWALTAWSVLTGVASARSGVEAQAQPVQRA